MVRKAVYERSKFDSLPHGITRSTASTIITDAAVVFQGHCSEFSNLHRSALEDDTYEYSCNEQHFGYRKAIDCSNDVQAAKILCETNPYRIHDLAKEIQATREWENKEYSILKEGARLRILQHKEFRDLLMRNRGKKFYEATLSRKFGAGFSLQDARQGNIKVAEGYQNCMGTIYEELIEELSDK